MTDLEIFAVGLLVVAIAALAGAVWRLTTIVGKLRADLEFANLSAFENGRYQGRRIAEHADRIKRIEKWANGDWRLDPDEDYRDF
jgi:hypothetical protein